jgi:hypothetical protein
MIATISPMYSGRTAFKSFLKIIFYYGLTIFMLFLSKLQTGPIRLFSTAHRYRYLIVTIIADPDPGSGAFLTSWIRNRFFPELASQIPNPYFRELCDKILVLP